MKLIHTLLLSSVLAFGAAGAVLAQDTTAQPAGPAAGPPAGGGGGAANRFQTGQRAPPSEGGAYGVITGVSAKSFAILAPSGRSATVELAPDTTYRKGKLVSSARAIKVGDRVRVLGTVAFGVTSTITATHVVLQPVDGAGTETSLKVAEAVSSVLAAPPRQGGAGQGAGGAGGPRGPGGPGGPGGAGGPRAGGPPGGGAADPGTHRVGQVPSVYVEGGGTIVVGVEADKATEAGMAAPWGGGGMINRVVKLSDGSYEVHNIGTNWPHHLFVSADFKAMGAD